MNVSQMQVCMIALCVLGQHIVHAVFQLLQDATLTSILRGQLGDGDLVLAARGNQ